MRDFVPMLRTGVALSALVLLTAQQPAPPPAQQPDTAKKAATRQPLKIDPKLKFIAGCWRGTLDGGETFIEENWSTPSENLYLATTRYLTKKDRATGFEFTRIEATDSGVAFIASSNGEPPNTYMLKTLVDEYVLFENPKATFPQRIMYRMSSDGWLIPRNEGQGPSLEVRLQRVMCPGADVKLKP
ncbi:MAG: hypothetical protein HOP28_04820 [Gemmatimonadales bacterium]|nr:hypothetical protein [Gemmatimonadales bacterium]